MNEKRQNIIWIVSDQHRGQALSCNGDPNVSTPNIDAMAAQGVNFVGAVGGYPLCCPFRGSMLTSAYPHKCVPGHEKRLPPDQMTVADVFNDAGYHTAYIGKWHLDGFQERDGRAAMHIVPPERRGRFQYWVGYENNNSQYDCWIHGGEGGSAFHRRLPGYETDELTSLFLEYLERQAAAGPFFAVLSVQPPHNPYVAPAEYMRRFNPGGLRMRANVPDIASVQRRARAELAGAYAMIENIDFNIGRVRQKLHDLGIEFNTRIFYFSDHGDMHGSHGEYNKTTAWEESIRVPCVIGGPPTHYGDASGLRTAQPFNHVDYAPTSLGLCGIDVPDWMEGTDYSAVCGGGGPEAARRAAPYPDSAYIQSVVPTGHWDSCDRAWRGVVTRDGWKYVCFENTPWMLYNLNDDPYELMNLAHNTVYADMRGRLNNRLREWIDKTGDSFRLPAL